MVSFFRPTATRYKILMESKAFPSDQVLVDTAPPLNTPQSSPVRGELSTCASQSSSVFQNRTGTEGGRILNTTWFTSNHRFAHLLMSPLEDIEAVLNEQGSEIALVLLCGVQYYTGQCFPMERVTALAHSLVLATLLLIHKGCVVGFDLAHAAGNIPLHLHDWGVDFAVWCTYKYLNSGPGSIGCLFVHSKHAENQNLVR